MGPAAKLLSLLQHELVIDYKEWTENWDTTLQLFTWGLTKLYDDVKVLTECSTEDVVALLIFERNDDSLEDDGDADGVFSRFAQMQSLGEDFSAISRISEWREKLIEWVRAVNVDGRKLKMVSLHNLAQDMTTALLRGSREDRPSLISPCMTVLKLCRRCPVQQGLQMAAAEAQRKLSESEERWRFGGRVAAILGSSVIRSLKIARQSILERKRHKGALTMQTYFRSTSQRLKYLQRVSILKTATNVIWESYRGWQWRNQLRTALNLKVQQTTAALTIQSFFRGAHIRCEYLHQLKQGCPYKCEVLIWNEALKKVEPCGRPCASQDHNHALKMDRGDCKDEGHTCDETHPCPHECTEEGICRIEVMRRIVEQRATFITGGGSKIEYDAYAEVNAEKRRCAIRIPVGKFRHDGDEHKCYCGDRRDNIHTCDEQCELCGYYCHKEFGHLERYGSDFHDCVHGNMRNAVFHSTKEFGDTGGGRKYQVGDRGVTEICNVFCERMGRGHTHLMECEYAKSGHQCVEENGRRHQTKQYYPNPEIARDEVKHSKYWSWRKWKDPCVKQFRREFDKCNFGMLHGS